MKQINSVVLALSVLISMSACSGATVTEETSEQLTKESLVTETAAEEDILENRKLISDDLPQKDFEGEEYRLSVIASRQYEAYTEVENGDICNDAVYARNRTVEERFNTVFTPIQIADTDYVASIQKTAMAGDDIYDVVTMFTYSANSLILQELCQNWYNVPNINFDKPWWIGSAMDSYTVGDQCFVAVGSFNTTTLLRTYAIFFNRALAKDYDIGDLYSLVEDGRWTLDQLDTLTKSFYTDLNGNGAHDSSDQFGFLSDIYTCLDTFMAGADITIFTKDETGYPQYSLDVEKGHALFDRVLKLYHKNEGSYTGSDTAELVNIFVNGRALFFATWLDNAFTAFRDMEDDYGILPWPKYDEEQDAYLTTSMDNVSAMLLPVTSNNLELVGIITEALYAESYKTVMPAYYDTVLKVKLTRDPQSVEMLDLIMNGIRYDFAFLHYQNLNGITQVYRNLIQKDTNTFASHIASIESSLLKNLEKILDVYRELET